MQMAAIEFARNVLGLKNANSEEIDTKTNYPVIHIMPKQKEYLEKKKYGGTIRLGAWPCVIEKETVLDFAYKKYGGKKTNPWYLPNPKMISEKQKPKTVNRIVVFERHRHRYEFNNKYKNLFIKNGFIFSGSSPDRKLVEAIELHNHPFFVGTQFHPEYLSRPLTPHPIFLSFVEAAIKK